jgi:hypothetical protein
MAYTLAQLVKLETDPARKYVLTNLLREVKVMEVLPFQDVNSLTTAAIRWRLLPPVAFRDLGSDYTEDTTGDVEEVWESLYILGGLLKFDRVYGKVGNTIVDPQKLQMDMKIKSLGLTFNNYFINGDLAVDALGFEGLKKRVSLMPTRQLVAVGGAVSAYDVTASAAAVNRFWTDIEQSYRRCNNGQVSAMFCNEDLLLGLGRSLRYINSAGGNFLDVTKDNFDRSVVTYKGTPIYDMGLKKDQSTEIITDTELDADATHSVSTSLYFCSFNMEQGITGIQLGPLEVIPEAKKDVGTANQTLIEWVLGLAGFGSYGFVRMYNTLAPDTWTA